VRNKEDVFEQIKKRSLPVTDKSELCFGKLLLTGLSNGVSYNFDSAVGFVCQIREKADTGGDDVYLLRHPNAELICYLEQGFFVVPDDLVREALLFFKRGVDIEMIENPEIEYTIGEYLNEKGFLVPEREKPNLDM